MKKNIITCLLILILLVGCGKSAVTEENFVKGLNKYLNSEYNDNGYEVTTEKNAMVVKKDDKEYKVKYNLKGNPTFSHEVKIEKGISYEEYSKKIETLSLPMLGYIALAHNYGVSIEDSSTYFTFSYISGYFDEIDDEDTFTIIDDDIEIDNSKNVIRTSKFGERVIDYVKATYDDEIDFDDELETYDYKVVTKCNKKSCTIKSILEVNPKANFQRIIGYAEQRAKEGMDKDITPETAKYNIELKVGQKIKITGKKLSGYEIKGMNVVEVSGEYVFEATKRGVANGYFHIGEKTKRSFYITVTEPEKDEELKTKKLTVK